MHANELRAQWMVIHTHRRTTGSNEAKCWARCLAIIINTVHPWHKPTSVSISIRRSVISSRSCEIQLLFSQTLIKHWKTMRSIQFCTVASLKMLQHSSRVLLKIRELNSAFPITYSFIKYAATAAFTHSMEWTKCIHFDNIFYFL